jgi:hypothetical protein
MILKRLLTFATPSAVNDTPEARAKVERDYKEILREAYRYSGPERVRELNKEVAIERRGNTPNKPLNERLLAEHDVAAADGLVEIPEFSEAFYEKYPQQAHSAAAVRVRLRRLLKAREKARDMDRELKARLQCPSLVGEAGGTK